jgi:prepilin-type N-terminal cleavage/methylation domain-containing protein
MKMLMKFQNRKGFSLVELMITIGIFAILAAIAIPSFQRHVVNADLRNAARSIATDFFLYKEHAIAENRPYRILFNTGDNSYEVQQPPGTAIATKSLTTFRYDIAIDMGGTTLIDYTIQPRGTVTNGAVRLTNSRGSTATVTINITGKTSVTFNMQ